MSGGQDEASEYIQTGGTNVFKKTERTKCGNCVYFDNGKCVRMPMTWTKLPEDYCGEFFDREPEAKPIPCCGHRPKETTRVTGDGDVWTRLECIKCGRASVDDTRDGAIEAWRVSACEPHSNAGEVTVQKEGDKPAELREWWVSVCDRSPLCFAVDRPGSEPEISYVHVREVPSPERVREALEKYIASWEAGWKNWEHYQKHQATSAQQMLTLLRSLGIDIPEELN